MNLLSFLSFLILAITLLTMVFGIVAYFLYKAKEKKKQKEKFSLEQKEIIKLIAGANNNLVIKDKVSRYVYKCEFNIKIDKYVEKEELPIIFVDMAKQKDGLYIILKNYIMM